MDARAAILKRYMAPQDSCEDDIFTRVARTYCEDMAHEERLVDYMRKGWMMPSTPILTNAGTDRGNCISCFVNEAEDSIDGISRIYAENIDLASKGGGIGSYFSNIRSINEEVGEHGKTSGVIPFIKVVDSLTLAISQANLRRGSAAVYMNVEHPEIEEFLDIRRPTGGDINRKCLNIHQGVCIPDAFMRAVEQGDAWPLKSPKTGEVLHTIQARELWIKILTNRLETGEPYLLFTDTVNKNAPDFYQKNNIKVKTSNLCSEITLSTEKTNICCLASLNLEFFDEWKDSSIVEDVALMLKNVLYAFAKKYTQGGMAGKTNYFYQAALSIIAERNIGIGVMGLHSYLQAKNIPFDSKEAWAISDMIFGIIRTCADYVSKKYKNQITGFETLLPASIRKTIAINKDELFTHKIAIAPTASISLICNYASPGVEPYISNIYTLKNLDGNFTQKNPYLSRLLQKKGQDTPEVWDSIMEHQGSVKHLEFLSREEKQTFKTAYEIAPDAIVLCAGTRAQYICQSQSINLFLTPDINKTTLHNLHFYAWKHGVKSLYYVRSQSIQRAANIMHCSIEDKECEACQ